MSAVVGLAMMFSAILIGRAAKNGIPMQPPPWWATDNMSAFLISPGIVTLFAGGLAAMASWALGGNWRAANLGAVALGLAAMWGWTGFVYHWGYFAAINKAAPVFAALFVLPVARFIMGPIAALTVSHVGELVVVTLLGAGAFSVLGLLMGTAIQPQQIGLMFSIIVAPMIFFGCAYYPWRGLDRLPALKYAVLVNPLVYVAEGMRGVLTPSLPHMSLWIVSLALAVLTAVFWWVGVRTFEKRAIS